MQKPLKHSLGLPSLQGAPLGSPQDPEPSQTLGLVQGFGPPGSEVPDETSGYSYGHDPIMRVTIRGELLLLTDWERGTWLAKEKKWSQQLPPLMPKDVLVRLKASGALRPEDQKRLTGEAGAGSKRTRSSRR